MFSEQDRARCDELLQKYYAGRKFHDALYRDLIRKYLRPGDTVLDAGCGRYLTFCREVADTAWVAGIDLDTELHTDNGSSPFAIRGDLSRIPFPSGHFDLIISRSVIEHVADPRQVFREFARVLRPGGKAIILTPNKYDYVSVIAALTPYWMHQALVSRIFRVPEDDVFPTLYRANTLSALRKAMESAGMKAVQLDTINHYPAYLMFSPMLFRIGVLYERLTSLSIFRQLRGSILSVFEKSASVGVDVGKKPASAAQVS